MTPIIVRPPHPDDEPVWSRLWAAYLDFYGAQVSPEATRQTWEGILTPVGAMFGRIAELNDAAVGFAIGVVHEGTWSLKPTCYLEDLFVAPAARGGGVGRALIDDLVALGGERDWTSIYWHTRADNAQARKLYDCYVAADDVVRYRLTTL